MQPIIYRMRLDASKHGSQAQISVKQGDTKSRELRMHLYNGSEPYVITEGVTVVLRAIKPDETLVYSDSAIEGNAIIHTVRQQMLTAVGIVRCDIVVYGTDNQILFSPFFEIYVEKSLYGEDEIISTSEFSALTDALERVEALEAGTEEAEEERVTNEESRIQAENGRVTAENTRVNLYDQVKSDYESGAFSATVTAGDTTTLAPGQPASVTQRGDAQDRILDFAIPRGETGAGLSILGQFDTLAELEAAHPTGSPGDMYSVGATAPRDIYQWSDEGWISEGPMAGGGGTIKKVNDISPDENGEVTLNAENIPYDPTAQPPVSTREAIKAITDSKGQPSGIGTLTALGKQPAPQMSPGVNPANLGFNQLIPDATIIQRALTQGNVPGQYGPDRWKLISGSWTAVGSGLNCTVTLDGIMRQPLEFPSVHQGDQITASIEDAEVSIGINGDQTPFAPSATATLPAILTDLYVDIKAAGTIPKYLQITYGDERLPFVPPDMGIELAKCRRYYIKWNGYAFACVRNTGATADEVINILFPVSMRATPIVTTIGNVTFTVQLPGIDGFAAYSSVIGYHYITAYTADAEL